MSVFLNVNQAVGCSHQPSSLMKLVNQANCPLALNHSSTPESADINRHLDKNLDKPLIIFVMEFKDGLIVVGRPILNVDSMDSGEREYIKRNKTIKV